ncbi:DUF484 family protein [Thiocapsa imhoffii]|uniref:DUF484 family protein n=1 Tax=Thiocapsa imhoffii TaxID=382777 RepID=UPI0030B8C7FD
MSSQGAPPETVVDDADDERVAAYLKQHPEFLLRNPAVLAELEIPHPSGPAVSLIERQVRVLRQELEAERQRLTHLVARAREYEALSERLHQLVLKLFAAQDSAQVCALLKDTLLSEFAAEAMALKLFQAESESGPRRDPLTLAFRGFLDHRQSLCGALNQDKAQILFGDQGAMIRSAAVVPVHAGGHVGVLAIGSRDPDRFRAEMGTDLLDRLGEILGHKLRLMTPMECGETLEQPTQVPLP